MNARTQQLIPRALEVVALGEAERREMFALYARYYEGTTYGRFSADLGGKERVVILHDESGELCGFSTLSVYQRRFAGEELRVLFSGDTVVDERHWGQQALAFAWLRLAGEIKAAQPQTRLYWFLISKGHRTYRYLSAFSREYYPAAHRATPVHIGRLMAFLARDRFGEAFDESAGVLRFAQPQGHLRSSYAEISQPHRRLPEVEFFLSRNPGYVRGEELVCLCELAAENLQPIARRAFRAAAR